MATDMAQQAEAETLKPSSGTDALWGNVVKALLVSVAAVLEGDERSFSVSAAAERLLGESGAEVISASLLCKALRVTGMDMHLRDGVRKDQAEERTQSLVIFTFYLHQTVNKGLEDIPLHDSGEVFINRGIPCSCPEQSAANLMSIGHVHQHCGQRRKNKHQ